MKRDSERIRKEAERNYLLLILFTLVVVGGALIALIYGPEALLTALPCLFGGAGLILIPWLLLTALERWRNRLEAAEMESHYSDQAEEKEKSDDNTRAGSF